MAVKLRIDNERRALASVGDAPNGLLIICFDPQEYITFGIDSGWEPSGTGEMSIQVVDRETLPETVTPITVEEASAACESAAEAEYLWLAGLHSLRSSVDFMIENGLVGVHPIETLVRFIGEVREQLESDGWIEPMEGDDG